MVREIAEIKEQLELLKRKHYENNGSHIDYCFDWIEADLERLDKYIQRKNKN
jgi:hypothetical protein